MDKNKKGKEVVDAAVKINHQQLSIYLKLKFSYKPMINGLEDENLGGLWAFA